MNKWIVAFFALFLALGTACKDELTLSEAGQDMYMTITPSSPTLIYGDTLQLACQVVSHSGKAITDAKVEWTSDDPTLVRFLEEGRIVAEQIAIGREVKVRAKLANGRYALATVKVSSTKAESLELMTYAVSTAKKKEKVKNPETGVEEEREVPTYSVNKSYLGESVFIPIAGSLDFVVEAMPEGSLRAGDIEVVGAGGGLCEITKIELDPELDADKIAVTPKSAVWYKVRSTGGRGSVNVTFRAPGKGAKETTIAMNFGTKLEKIGFNKSMDVVEISEVLDIRQEKEVVIYTEVMPSTDEDIEVIKQSAEWSITDVRGGGGSIIEAPTVERGEGTAVVLKAKIKAGLLPGNFSVRCVLQGKTLAATYTVIDKAGLPFDDLKFEGVGFDDLYAGEAKSLRIRILPLSSLVYLLQEMQISYSTPDIVEAIFNDGIYNVTGKKAGQTDLIATVRGREFRFPIIVKPAPKSVLIDSRTPDVLMQGDEVAWTADVQMEGGDQPVWSNLKWSIADTKYAKFAAANNGKSVRIKALELTEGEGVSITADYRGKKNARNLKVIPVQQSISLVDGNIDAPESGVTISDGGVKLELTSKNAAAQPSINILMKPKNGAAAVEAKAYSGSDYDIGVQWTALNLRKAAVNSSSVTLTEVGGKWNAVVNITMTVDGKNITVTGTLTGLEKF